MSPVDELTLLVTDTTLQCVGALLFGAVGIHLFRSGQWRNPLTQLDFTGQGPSLIHVAGVLAAFYVLLLALVKSAPIDPEAARVNGSHDWHLARCVEDGAKLVAGLLIVIILRRYHTFGAGASPRLGALGVLLVSGAAVLIIMPVSYVQLQMGKIIWRWLEPGAQQPIHPVLEALESSAWGSWGAAQLSFAAIIVAPLAEELFFRGLLLQALWRSLGHAWLAIVLSGAAFGLIHSQQPQDVLPLITMGVILGYVRVRYRSLTTCIFAHALFNAHTMVLVLLDPELARSGW